MIMGWIGIKFNKTKLLTRFIRCCVLFSFSKINNIASLDGVIYVSGGTVKPGTLVKVGITKAHDYDLEGNLL